MKGVSWGLEASHGREVTDIELGANRLGSMGWESSSDTALNTE